MCIVKIGGIDPATLPTVFTLVIPRGDTGRLVFQATGLKDMEKFKKLCPEPVPPIMQTKDGKVADVTDKDYVNDLTGYLKRRTAYYVVFSLEPSNIEWDTVDLESPGTWINWEVDLKKAGLSDVECGRVLSLVTEANCLDEAKLQKARLLFLAGTQVPLQK
jgi:hypothetical protein